MSCHLLLLRRFHQSEDVHRLCAAGRHQINIVCTECQAADLDEPVDRHNQQSSGRPDNNPMDYTYLFIPRLNSSSLSPEGMLNTLITVP